MNRPIFLISFFSIQLRGSKLRTSPAIRQSNAVASKAVMVPTPLRPATRFCQTSSVPIPHPQTKPTPVTTTRRLNRSYLLSGNERAGYFFPAVCFSMYPTASFTVAIFSASSSGISMLKDSSKAITSSTVSSESAPKSSTNEAVGVTSPSSTPSCSTMICFTRSSTLAILYVPPLSASCNRALDLSGRSRRVKFGQARAFYAWLEARSTLEAHIRASSSSPHVHSAVYVQDVSGNIRCLVARQKNNCRRDIHIRSRTAHRNPPQHEILHILRQRVGHWGGDETRSDGVYCDIARSDFHRDRARQPDHPRLCRNVIRLPGISRLRNDRTHIDDSPRPLLEHRSQRLLRAKMRASEIGADHRIPILEFHTQRQSVARHSSVVHKYVQPPEFRQHLLKSRLHLRGLRDIHRHCQRFASSRLYLGHQRPELLYVARCHGNLRARLGKRKRGRASDSLRRTRNQRNFIFQ